MTTEIPWTEQPDFVCSKCPKRAVDGCVDCGIGRCRDHDDQDHDMTFKHKLAARSAHKKSKRKAQP